MTNPTPDPGGAEIVPRQSDYPLVDSQQYMGKVLRLIADNFGAQKFNILQLPRIRAMRDAPQFMVETPAGLETYPSISGVISTYRTTRVFWGDRAYNPEKKEPPSCTSIDGFMGEGNPGGECAKCPKAQFKSARNPDGSPGAGQACREHRQILFLLPGQILPHRLDVNPTSLQDFGKYTLNLLYGSIPFWAVVTKLTLEMGSTIGGQRIPRVKFAMAKRLAPEQAQIMAPYHESMQSLLAPMVVDADRYEMTGRTTDNDAAPPSFMNPDDVPF